MNPDILHSLLNRALTEELGLVITTNNPHAMATSLNYLTANIPDYASLTITVPSTPDTVIIVRHTVELNEDV